MAQRLDQKLECSHCKTVYLNVPKNLTSDSPIHCTSCGEFLGRWSEMETSFANQGGYDGAFKLEQGRITRID
jgi:hypothetical protein